MGKKHEKKIRCWEIEVFPYTDWGGIPQHYKVYAVDKFDARIIAALMDRGVGLSRTMSEDFINFVQTHTHVTTGR